MQMDTVARKAESLRQALIQLGTGTGNITNLTKGVLGALTSMITTLNSLNPTGFLLFLGGGAALFGAQKLVSVFRLLGEALTTLRNAYNAVAVSAVAANTAMSTGGVMSGAAVGARTLGVELKNVVSTAPGLIKLAGVIAMVAGAIIVYNNAQQNLREQRMAEADALSSQVQLEQELINRKEQALESIKAYAEGYNAVTERLQETNLSEEERNQLLDQQEQSHEALVNIVGEEDAKNAEAHVNESGYIDDIIRRKKDEFKTKRDGLIAQLKGLGSIAEAELDYATQVAANLDIEKKGIQGVADELWKLGHYWDYARLKAYAYFEKNNRANADYHSNLAHEAIARLDEGDTESSVLWAYGGALGKVGDFLGIGMMNNRDMADMYLNEANRQLNDADWWQKEENRIVNETKSEEVGGALSNVQKIQSIIAGASGNGFNQDQTGGSEVGDNTGLSSGSSGPNNGSSSSSGSYSKPTGIGGIELTLPDTDNFAVNADISPFSQDLRMKMRVLDDWYYKYTSQVYGQGEHLNITSGYRPNDTGSNHGTGHAFDVSTTMLEQHPELTQALAAMGSYVGLFSINEYPGQPGEKYANGSNVHFSDVQPGQLGVTRDSEGKWSEENSAPSIYSILGNGSRISNYVDNSVQRQLYDTLRNLGGIQRSDQSVWGAMASIGYESSGFNPAAIQGGGTDPQLDNPDVGIGLMQWTGARKKAFIDFVKERGTSWQDLGTQLAFIQEEYANGSEQGSWDNYFNSVNGNAWNDVAKFTELVERADPQEAHINDRVSQYYPEISSHYANGMSLYDSSPNKSGQKRKTPEELAKERASALQKQYDELNKGLDNFTNIIDNKYKTVLENVAEDQKYFGTNIDNTTKQLNAYSNQIADTTALSLQYHKAIQNVSSSVNAEEFKRYTNVDLNDFFDASLADKQKILANAKSTSQLYAPIKAQLNEIITLEQKLQGVEAKIHKQRMEWADTEAKTTLGMYDTEIKNYQDILDRYKAIHSNDMIDDFSRNDYEQQYLEEQARLARQKYEQAQEIIRDNQGRPVRDAEGNERRYGGTPEQIEQTRIAWLNADAAAKKYAATLKNDVKKNMADIFSSIFVDGKKASDILKELWQQLGHDAWQLLITGKGTDSPLGNFLRSLGVGRRQDTVRELNNAGFNYEMPEVEAWRQAYVQPYSFSYDWRTASMRRIVSQAESAAQQPVRGVSLEQYLGPESPVRGVNLDEASKKYDISGALASTFTPMNPMPVQVMNLPSVGGGTAGNLARSVQEATDSFKDYLPKPDSLSSIASLTNATTQAANTRSQLQFASGFNWMAPPMLPAVGAGAAGGSGWGSMALASKIGLIGMGLPLLFSLFKHHATGGEIDKEELAVIGEGNKKEYVIPTEQNQPRGIALWQKAGQDLGILSKGTQIAPDFKNKEIAQNGVVSTSVRQQAVYMDEMRQQNKTLLNILAFMANNQAESNKGSGNGVTIVQPVVMKQDMDIASFTKMYQKGKAYNYIK